MRFLGFQYAFCVTKPKIKTMIDYVSKINNNLTLSSTIGLDILQSWFAR